MAAYRAGLSRAGELADFPIKSSDDGALEYVNGHQAPCVARGFEGKARLLALGRAAMSALRKSSGWHGSDHGRTAVFLALPRVDRRLLGLDRVESESVRDSLTETIRTELEGVSAPSEGRRFLSQLVRSTGINASLDLSKVHVSEHCGMADAFSAASTALQSGRVDIAVVGGIDSLLDDPTLQWLYVTGRIKTDAIPTGLFPGEAACFVILESSQCNNHSDSQKLGKVEAICKAKEPGDFLSGSPPSGEGTAEVLTPILERGSARSGQSPVWIISDQNGEMYRALDWGAATVRLESTFGLASRVEAWYPAMSFGDTYSASGFIGLIAALQAFERGYAVGSQAVILSAADNGERSAVLISRVSK